MCEIEIAEVTIEEKHLQKSASLGYHNYVLHICTCNISTFNPLLINHISLDGYMDALNLISPVTISHSPYFTLVPMQPHSTCS